MTRMTRPDCAVMCNLINTYTHIHTHTHNLTNTHTHTHTHIHTHTHTHAHTYTSAIDPPLGGSMRVAHNVLELWSFSIVQVKCYGCHVMEDLEYVGIK